MEYYSGIKSNEILVDTTTLRDFPGDSYGKESSCKAGRQGFSPWVGKIPREVATPLQYSCLENPMDRGD